jgi:type I restriction enzyme S subunit
VKAYPKYKDSGIEWLGEVPEEWNLYKLKYTSDVIMGQSPSSDDYSEDSDMLPFLQGNADFTKKYSTPRVYCDGAKKTITKGSLLISVRAPVGALNEADQEYGIGRGLCAVKPKTSLSKEYIWYMLHVTRLELESLATGSTYDAVSVDEVADMSILIPSKREQQAIASFLDRETARIDALIQKKERMIELLKEKRIALITQAVTKGLDPNAPMKDSGIEWLGEVPEHWEVKRIKHVATRIQTGCTPPTSKEQYYEDGTIQWFGPSSFTGDLYLSDPVKIINESSVTDGVARLSTLISEFVATP